MRQVCPNCGKQLVEPNGNPRSPILIVGEAPGLDEIKRGICFVGRTGEVLQAELARQGIQVMTCRLTNLWLHAKSDVHISKSSDNTVMIQAKKGGCDPRWHLDQLVKEFTGKTHVLLMGSEVTSAILGTKSAALAGLQVKVPDFPKIKFFVSPNPAIVFRSPIGDLRLSVERFAADTRKK
jgi:uracil-DNA glycosylase family 4